jgi:hypothetical protein
MNFIQRKGYIMHETIHKVIFVSGSTAAHVLIIRMNTVWTDRPAGIFHSVRNDGFPAFSQFDVCTGFISFTLPVA